MHSQVAKILNGRLRNAVNCGNRRAHPRSDTYVAGMRQEPKISMYNTTIHSSARTDPVPVPRLGLLFGLVLYKHSARCVPQVEQGHTLTNAFARPLEQPLWPNIYGWRKTSRNGETNFRPPDIG